MKFHLSGGNEVVRAVIEEILCKYSLLSWIVAESRNDKVGSEALVSGRHEIWY